MAGYYMSIDIGTSAGHQIMGYLEDGALKLEEVHCFENEAEEKDGELYWNMERIFQEVVLGLRKCWEIGKLPIFIGVSAWGSDFVLLDTENQQIGNVVSSRNSDTAGQLMAVKEKHPDYFERADNILFAADYLTYLLSGVKCCEYTNAVTTGLASPDKGCWNEEKIEKLEVPNRIFPGLCPPGTVVNNLTRRLTEETGYDCIVVRVEANRDHPNRIVAEIAKETKSADPVRITALSSIITMMGTAHQFKDTEEIRQCLQKYFSSVTS
jgi:rhamnulokinase